MDYESSSSFSLTRLIRQIHPFSAIAMQTNA
jgi:hypothetical protein